MKHILIVNVTVVKVLCRHECFRVLKKLPHKATAYKGEDKYFIFSFVIPGRRGNPAQIYAGNEPKSMLACDLGDCRDNE